MLYIVPKTFQTAHWFFFNFSAEADHVLALFLYFGQIELQCSYKVCYYRKKRKRECFPFVVNAFPLQNQNF